MQFTDQHNEIRRTVQQFVEKEVNPYVDEWEEAGIFPAHEVFKKAGDLGLLGINKPEKYGGMGLDYGYAMVAMEEWGLTACGSIPMVVGVQTDMATPALGPVRQSRGLKQEFRAPTIAGDYVSCIAVSEPDAGSDVASIKTSAVRQVVTSTSSTAPRCGSPMPPRVIGPVRARQYR